MKAMIASVLALGLVLSLASESHAQRFFRSGNRSNVSVVAGRGGAAAVNVQSVSRGGLFGFRRNVQNVSVVNGGGLNGAAVNINSVNRGGLFGFRRNVSNVSVVAGGGGFNPAFIGNRFISRHSVGFSRFGSFGYGGVGVNFGYAPVALAAAPVTYSYTVAAPVAQQTTVLQTYATTPVVGVPVQTVTYGAIGGFCY